MMAADAEPVAQLANGVTDRGASPFAPSTPQDMAPPESSQAALPTTEAPPSDDESFKTELNDDRPEVSRVIPSSLTPPPSTQVTAHPNNARRTFSQSYSQQSNLASPPATITRVGDHRDVGSDYMPPEALQIQDASTEELRSMLQTCIAEHQKLKMETAHYKLQFNLLSMQAEDDAKRAAVEHEMVRREVDALRTAEHLRQAKRELSTTSEAIQTKYFELKMIYEDVVDENANLNAKVKSAKRVIQDLQDRCEQLDDDRQMYINRIRENRERFHMLTSPGGLFHGILTPKKDSLGISPQRERRTREYGNEREHVAMSALLQAVSQDNNSAPTTPVRAYHSTSRQGPKHSRNSQSMSALPTTPLNRDHDVADSSTLLPSADLIPRAVPQTEPTRRFTKQPQVSQPMTPTMHRQPRRKSRESTISESDNEELARQALESITGSSTAHLPSQPQRSQRSSQQSADTQSYQGSQASQAATELLRRDSRQGFEVARESAAVPRTAVDKSATVQAKLLSSLRAGSGRVGGDKRKFSGSQEKSGGGQEERIPESPEKRRKVGLGIQYGH